MTKIDRELFELLAQNEGKAELNPLSTGKSETLWRGKEHGALFQSNVVDLGDLQKIELFVNRSLLSLDEKANALNCNLPIGLLIFEHQKHFAVLVPTGKEVRSGLSDLVQQAFTWVHELDPVRTIDDLAATCPDNPPMRQKAHLIALVIKADFLTIDDYKSAFNRGCSNRFANIVTFDFLDRCFDEAIALA